jgi:hypothetical protein
MTAKSAEFIQGLLTDPTADPSRASPHTIEGSGVTAAFVVLITHARPCTLLNNEDPNASRRWRNSRLTYDFDVTTDSLTRVWERN